MFTFAPVKLTLPDAVREAVIFKSFAGAFKVAPFCTFKLIILELVFKPTVCPDFIFTLSFTPGIETPPSQMAGSFQLPEAMVTRSNKLVTFAPILKVLFKSA